LQEQPNVKTTEDDKQDIINTEIDNSMSSPI